MGLLDAISNFMFEQTSSSTSRDEHISQRANAFRVKDADRDPTKSLAKKISLQLSGDGREYLEPETDLSVIETAYNTEAYVRQGIDKYIDKMFKAGWKFVGKNPNTVDYIRIRFAYMAETTQLPTEKLFIEYSEDVVKFSNAILAKARMSDQNQLPPNLTVTGYAGRQPVVGYFPVNVTTMKVKRDKVGTIKGWEQEVTETSNKTTFKPEDIIHTYYKRTKGNAFGTPFVAPVLDDIRALRQAEDNVLKMMYRNINPFYHIKIGSDEYPADTAEIEYAQSEFEDMEVDGGLVTSERWNINAIASDKVIDANPYLKYFEDRVFSGLGVPATMFGRGATANKSTSENQSAEFVDRVKAFQKVIEADVNEFMIKELLLEGGFDPILNPDDMVYFRFNEIDIDMQVKLENHAVYKYEHNAITETEMRQLLGLDIITDRSEMFNELITLNTVRETYKAESQYDIETAMATANLSGGSDGSSGSGSGKKSTTKTGTNKKGTAETNNKVSPKNQHSPKDSIDFAQVMTNHLEELNDEINLAIDKYFQGDKHALSQVITTISFKESLLVDIYKTLDSDATNVQNMQLRVQRSFDTIRGKLTETLCGIQSNSTIGIESAKETTNSVFKVVQNTLLHYFKKEV